MVNITARFRALVRDDSGQDIVEYALLAGLVSLIATAAVFASGTRVNAIWEGIQAVLEGTPTPAPPGP